ncbi:hypothetical protein BpHYR1_013146 [Brachionus plicatilis]|uniref:Uncharacterized protein n=1 Tax=Brachionus plicatilis TaxID=10195 RepID=A0A3M7RQS2_BRAPC|nr:hypothetical protein BpHYR1_013146 [Brachionus plicatilis]
MIFDIRLNFPLKTKSRVKFATRDFSHDIILEVQIVKSNNNNDNSTKNSLFIDRFNKLITGLNELFYLSSSFSNVFESIICEKFYRLTSSLFETKIMAYSSSKPLSGLKAALNLFYQIIITNWHIKQYYRKNLSMK